MGHTIHFRECIVFDLETTGFDFQNDRIIEVCAIHINDDLNPVREFYSLVKIERDLPEKITALTGITKKDLDEKGCDREDVLRRFKVFLGNHTLVGHSIDVFDVPFLRVEFGRYGMDITNPTLDTLTKSREFFKFPRYTLSAMADNLNLYCSKLHNARADVNLNIEVFKRLLKADG